MSLMDPFHVFCVLSVTYNMGDTHSTSSVLWITWMHLCYLESLWKVYPGPSSVGSTVGCKKCIIPEDLKHIHESSFNFRHLGVVGEQQHEGIWTRKHVREATVLLQLKKSDPSDKATCKSCTSSWKSRKWLTDLEYSNVAGWLAQNFFIKGTSLPQCNHVWNPQADLRGDALLWALAAVLLSRFTVIINLGPRRIISQSIELLDNTVSQPQGERPSP